MIQHDPIFSGNRVINYTGMKCYSSLAPIATLYIFWSRTIVVLCKIHLYYDMIFRQIFFQFLELAILNFDSMNMFSKFCNYFLKESNKIVLGYGRLNYFCPEFPIPILDSSPFVICYDIRVNFFQERSHTFIIRVLGNHGVRVVSHLDCSIQNLSQCFQL